MIEYIQQNKLPPKCYEHFSGDADQQQINGVDRQMNPTTKPTGYVYIIAAEGTQFFKIGYSENPQFRLAELQTGCPHFLKIIGQWPGSMEAESQIHIRLESCRGIGEWFSISPETMADVRVMIELECQGVQASPAKVQSHKVSTATENHGVLMTLKAKRAAIRAFQPEIAAEYRMKEDVRQLCRDYATALLTKPQSQIAWMEEQIDGYIAALGISVPSGSTEQAA